MDTYIVGIGQKIKSIRKEKELYASEIARRAKVSNGLISRIENGRTIPSLPVLFSIIQALEVEPSQFFESIGQDDSFKYLLIPKDAHQTIEKEIEARGFSYELIYSGQQKSIGFEIVLLTLQPNCKRDTVETDALEFKYMLSGECEYIIDGEVVALKEGESIFFNGRLPHVPRNPTSNPAVMLVFYLFDD
ncbi:MAG: helix-turn-helix domain-containing protein [Balneolaceae bacterium]